MERENLDKLKDTVTFWKGLAIIWLKAIRFLLTNNPFKIARVFRRYPWMMQLLRFNYLYFSLCKGRQGNYLKATALTMNICADNILKSIEGPYFGKKEVVLFEDMISLEIFRAMGLTPYMLEFPGLILPLIVPDSLQTYIDRAENQGIPQDVCSAPRGFMGLMLEGQIPDAVASITTNSPCDAHVGAYTMLESEFEDLPTYHIDIPFQIYTEKGIDYVTEELKEMVEWLEENSSGKMDWDVLREVCEERNRMVQLELELWETLKMKPAPMAGEPVYMSHLLCHFFGPGDKDNTRGFEKILELSMENLKQGKPALPNERYRVICWGTPIGHFFDLFNWAERTWGITLIMENLTFNRIPMIDTTSPDTMMRGLAQVIMGAPMARHTRGLADPYLDDIIYVSENYNIDMIWSMANLGCKKATGLQGMLRERCRKAGIPLLFIDMDVFDERTISRDSIKRQINDFMENIMKAKPLVDGADADADKSAPVEERKMAV